MVVKLPPERILSLSREQAMELFPDWEILFDATSVKGGSALVREYPTIWREMIWAWTPEVRFFDNQLTLSCLLQSRNVYELMPKPGMSLNTLKRNRACARRGREFFGELAEVVVIGEDRLRDYQHAIRYDVARKKTKRCLGWEGRQRDVAFLRRVLRWAQDQCGLDPEQVVGARSPRERKRGRPTPAVVKTWRGAMGVRCMPTLQGKVVAGLAYGCRLLEYQSRRIRVCDVEVHKSWIRIWVRGPDPGSLAGHWEYVPRWLWPLVRRQLARVRDRPAGSPFLPGLQWRSFRKQLGRIDVSGERLTFVALRRLGQQVALANGLARGLVRGTLLVSGRDAKEPEEAEATYPAARRLAWAWTDPQHPPFVEPFRKRIPRRAPANTPMLRPELHGMGDFEPRSAITVVDRQQEESEQDTARERPEPRARPAKGSVRRERKSATRKGRQEVQRRKRQSQQLRTMAATSARSEPLCGRSPRRSPMPSMGSLPHTDALYREIMGASAPPPVSTSQPPPAQRQPPSNAGAAHRFQPLDFREQLGGPPRQEPTRPPPTFLDALAPTKK